MKDRTLKEYIGYTLLAAIAIGCITVLLPLCVTLGKGEALLVYICVNYIIWITSLATKDKEIVTGTQKLKRVSYILSITVSVVLAFWIINSGLTWFVIISGYILYRYKINKGFYTWAYTGGVKC